MSAVLGYEAMAGEEMAERVWVDTPGSHRFRTGCKDELLAAICELRPRKGARLVLLGTEVDGLAEAARQKLLGRVGFVPASGGLISSLNAWENISLQAAYHGTQPVARIAKTAREALAALGADPQRFLARLPDEMDPFERKLVAFLRLLAKEPALAVIDGLGEGLNREQSARAARFEAEYRARQPEGTLLFVDLAEETLQ